MRRAAFALVLALWLMPGCTSHSTEPPPPADNRITRTIDDLNYVHGRYFFIVRPAQTIADGGVVDLATLRVWVDDRSGADNLGTLPGYGYVDATASPGASARLSGDFDALQPLTDYTVTTSMYGDPFPVLILADQLSPAQILGVTYEEVLRGGARRAVGGVRGDTLDAQLLQAPRELLLASAANPDFYETDFSVAPFNQVREHEVKSVYDLLATNIDPATFELEIHRYDANLDEWNAAVKDGPDLVGYLRILGVDLFRDNGTGFPVVGPDQKVDRFTNANFVDFERGYVYFPDLRPFDPRIAGRPDATAEEDMFSRSRVPAVDTSIPGLRRLILWPAGVANPPGYGSGTTTPPELRANPKVYDKRNLQPTADRRYYLVAKLDGQYIASAPAAR
jgi:hypothetical protein